jgi:hypothetical protein
MLAIDTAGTYPEIQLLYTGLMTPGKTCYKVYQLAKIEPCIADSPENILHPFKETYSYNIYHEGDITLVTMGSVLAPFLCVKEELFFLPRPFHSAHIVLLF